MDRFTDKQAELGARKAAAARNYPTLWQEMISNWARPDNNDRAWLIYSANYLFCTSGVRWAMDPLTLHQRIPNAPEVDVSSLAALDYVVLTHRHADHLDLGLLQRLLPFPSRWIVPEFLLDLVLALNPPAEKLIIPQPGIRLELGELILIPFDGLHWEPDPHFPGGRRGVPAMGYLAEFNGKRWLLPGDVRQYDPGLLPSFGVIDGIFIHLWLGRGCALMDNYPLAEQFNKFIQALSPRRVILSHLNEFGRNGEDLWDTDHAAQVQDELRQHNPLLDIQTAVMGDGVIL